MIDKLLEVGGTWIIIPMALSAALAFAAKTLLGWHQLRGQNRKEFLECWQGGNQGDDIWLEVAVRHLTGTYIPASVIRAVDAVPDKVDSLLQIAEIWPLLKIDRDAGVAWRSEKHTTHPMRRRRWWAWNAGYVFVCVTAAGLGIYSTKVDPASWEAWVYGAFALIFFTLALRCLFNGDALKTADRTAPRWLGFLNARLADTLPTTARISVDPVGPRLQLVPKE
jgi:hypothetical protein